MTAIIAQLNNAGEIFVAIALPMLIQSSMLAALVLGSEIVLRKHLCAATRYWILMLVFVQLMLVPGLLSVPRTGGWSGISNVQANSSSSPASLPETVGHPYTYMAGAHQPVRSFGLSEATFQSNTLSWQGGVFLLWGATVLILGGLALYTMHREQEILKQAQPGNRLMKELFAYCCDQVGMTQPVRLRVSPHVQCPRVMGWFEPVVVVPQNLGPILGSRPLRASLMHNLAFIKQGYGTFSRFQTLIHILYFFHPLVWVVRWAAQRTAAEAVKEWVVFNGADTPSQHERLLAEVSQFSGHKRRWFRSMISSIEPYTHVPA